MFFSTQHKVALVAAATSAFVSSVAAHGQVHQVTANGVTNAGPNQYYAADSKNSKTVTRVMYEASSPAFVLPSGYSDPSKMSCEGSGNSPAPDVIDINAGSTLQVYWEGATSELKGKDGTGGLTSYNPWVHAMGPIMDYITSCDGDCTNFDATNAGWTKIAESGIDMSTAISSGLRQAMTDKPEKYYPTSGNGLWAMAKLVQQGSRWDIKIPSSLKSGQYIVRHEMAAIHNPLTSDSSSGPQHYIACVQVNVKNGGSASLPSGTKSSSLYSSSGSFAKFNVYNDNISSFSVPGPAVWDQSSSGSSGSSSTTKKASSSTTKKATSTSTKATATAKLAAVTSAATTSTAAASSTSSAGAACKTRKRGLDGKVIRRHRRAGVSRLEQSL